VKNTPMIVRRKDGNYMSEKILYPVFGSRSISAIMDHLKDQNMTFEAKYEMAEELKRRFGTVQFKVVFNKATGEIEKTELFEL